MSCQGMSTVGRFARCVAAGAAAVSSLAHASPGNGQPNILYFGNSFTSSYFPIDVPGVVDAMTAAASRQVGVTYRRTQGGASLGDFVAATGEQSLAHLATQILPAGESWDFIVIQGQSTEATLATGNPTRFRDNAQILYNTLAADHPSATAILFETWARHPNFNDFYPTPFDSPDVMQAEVAQNYRAVVNTLNAARPGSARYAGVGDAFARLGFPASLYGGDLYHANNRGQLLIALTLYGALYGPTTSRLAASGAFDDAAATIYLTRADAIALAATADAAGVPGGDADFDWDVDFDDLLTLAQHYGTPAGAQWSDGDFTGDGTVDFDDLLALAQAYGVGTHASALEAGFSEPAGTAGEPFATDWAMARSLVPEPVLSVVLLGICLPPRRRR